MQELLLPHLVKYPNVTPFDGYLIETANNATKPEKPSHWVILFSKKDENGKRLYLVGERILTLDVTPEQSEQNLRWKLTAVREFRHARDRASRYFMKRVNDLGA